MILLSIVHCGSVSAQDNYLLPGVISVSSTIAPSAMLNRDESNFYINGFAEYFITRKVSLRSDNYILVDGRNELPFIDQAVRSYFGMAYHFGKSNWDNHIGFQPGITLMRLTPSVEKVHNPRDLSASMAFGVGTTYYVWKYFNFFANLTYVRSKMSGVVGGPHQTDELIIAAGLGFQIPTKRKKQN